MSWLPRFDTYAVLACDDDGEFAGRCLRVAWRRWEIEISFGRHLGLFR